MSSRIIFFISFLFICALLAFTYYLEATGFTPCPLCILQRYTLILLGVIFLLASIFALRKLSIYFFSFLATIVSLLGIGLSGRQVWLQHSPNLQESCGASLQYMLQVFPIKRVLQEVFAGSAECTVKGWEFLSLSLAEWSLICFSLLLIVSISQIFRNLRTVR